MTKTPGLSGILTGKRKPSCAPDILGWREWVALPELGIPAIKAKIDTGARTSALRFWLHPLRNKQDIELVCEAPVVQRRLVKDSGGHSEERYVIESAVRIGDRQWTIELSLTSREDMMFRMLLGRSAITSGRLKIDPAASYLTGRGKGKVYKRSGNPGRTRI